MPVQEKKRVRARRTLLPWVGGKSRSADFIVSRLPAHRTYVELFCGGCAVLWRKPRSRAEVVNDADKRLVTLLRVLRYHPDELLRELAMMTHSRAEFEDALAQPGLTDIQRAARFLFVVKAAFGSKVAGPTFGYCRTSPPKFSQADLHDLTAAARERLDRVTVEGLDFAEAVRRYDGPETLFYADPPYLCPTAYAVPFKDADHVRLRDALAAAQGKALVSLGDTPRARELYAGWRVEEVAVSYTIGRDKTAAPPAKELLFAKCEK